MKKVVIGSDHAGFAVKERIKQVLEDEYEFIDVGTENEDSVDYPIYGEKVAREVANNPNLQGIVVCGSGIGISISANKVPGIRAALCYSKRAAEMSRLHNNANVLAIAGREKMMDDPVDIAQTFLKTKFSDEERHLRRVEQMMEIERHTF
jgi:ribose 5-phosphate isomerase B